ncbi:uncharacterized protein LAESUDRAFT_126944 [Laetiporus sulphureus 93-53]|uniref:Uncharacterized protein n=1 Tax=Laetiporus sulphureus 93-53 TaxID=1314785 RepID=A0A165EG45_9APHY|nr:uncharacterized protein LAESUDRAFT_126944 [Laetiporus sulphureus 93-53]KZT06987.1 hypothetical protein LAESUDRAFT_126944 [Laetiporus sulphureus 93-53]
MRTSDSDRGQLRTLICADAKGRRTSFVCAEQTFLFSTCARSIATCIPAGMAMRCCIRLCRGPKLEAKAKLAHASREDVEKVCEIFGDLYSAMAAARRGGSRTRNVDEQFTKKESSKPRSLVASSRATLSLATRHSAQSRETSTARVSKAHINCGARRMEAAHNSARQGRST